MKLLLSLLMLSGSLLVLTPGAYTLSDSHRDSVSVCKGNKQAKEKKQHVCPAEGKCSHESHQKGEACPADCDCPKCAENKDKQE